MGLRWDKDLSGLLTVNPALKQVFFGLRLLRLIFGSIRSKAGKKFFIDTALIDIIMG